MPFSPAVAEELLVKAARCCCLCRKFKGQKLEVHHIVPEANGGADTADNGIPLCFDCHADVQSYNDKHPKGRKYRPSELILLRDMWFFLVKDGKVGPHAVSQPKDDDLELARFFSQCLDRPAFQDPIRQEGSMEDFDKAMEDTVTAINTGCLRSRDGQVLAVSKGKSHLENKDWRKMMDAVVDLLRAIRSRYKIGIRLGQIHLGQEHDGVRFYDFRDHELANWFDNTRSEVIRLFNLVAEEGGIPLLTFPRNEFRRW